MQPPIFIPFAFHKLLIHFFIELISLVAFIFFIFFFFHFCSFSRFGNYLCIGSSGRKISLKNTSHFLQMTGWGREQISFKIELNISAKACLIILTYWNMDVPSNPKGRQKGYFHKPTILGSEFCYSYYSLLQKGLCRNEAIPIRFLAIALI